MKKLILAVLIPLMLGSVGSMAQAQTSAPGLPAACQGEVEHRLTVVVSPHPDDETRLTGYLPMAAARGDDLMMIQVTNGGGTAVQHKEGLTKDETIRFREREQDNFWRWITDDAGGPIIRLGQEDAATSQYEIEVAMLDVIYGMHPDTCPEFYVAAYPPGLPRSTASDNHADHINVVNAAYSLREYGYVVRFARHSGSFHQGGGMLYEAKNNLQRLQIDGALSSYNVIGYRSAKSTFDSIRAIGGATRIEAVNR